MALKALCMLTIFLTIVPEMLVATDEFAKPNRSGTISYYD